MIKLLMVIILTTLLSGCAFYGELIEYEDGFEFKSNRPCIIKKGDITIDGRTEPWLKINTPDFVGSKIGG